MEIKQIEHFISEERDYCLGLIEVNDWESSDVSSISLLRSSKDQHAMRDRSKMAKLQN
jgi:hypothetical protein